VRHPATADGYVAGAAVERAVLPLIREEHAKSDAEYHYFTRRPLDDPVYGMDAATNDATRMLQDRDRHDEQLPLFLLVGTGSTTESADGIDLLSVYGVNAVVVDAEVADPETREAVDTLVSPEIDGVDADLSTGALVASLASAVNDEVRTDLRHLPAVSYWAETPDRYVELARDAGYDAERVAELREAVALEAYYQSYQDKRELVADLLFEDSGNLAAHVSEQFPRSWRRKSKPRPRTSSPRRSTASSSPFSTPTATPIATTSRRRRSCSTTSTAGTRTARRTRRSESVWTSYTSGRPQTCPSATWPSAPPSWRPAPTSPPLASARGKSSSSPASA